ncbi:MAG TPA: hypothetical protein VIO58_12365 [Candidatus Methanoperedens sp.]
MSIKFVPLIILLVTAVFISGCIFDKNDQNQTGTESGLIPKTNLPAGFTYLGVHEIPFDIGSSSINATEGVYRYGDEDIYIQVIKNDNVAALMTQYKSDIKKEFNPDYDPFKEVTLNGHKATQVTDFSVIDGKDTPRYGVMWTNDNYLIVVGKSFDTSTVMTLATATGN